MTRSIIALVDDMMFTSKIRGTAEAIGVVVVFARSINEVCQKAIMEPVSLIIADLNLQCCDPFALAEQLKSDSELKAIQLLAFFSHVQTELGKRAEHAGYDRVLPRSEFSKNLPLILEGKY